MNVGLEHYLIVSALLFSLGLLGVITRRSLLIIYMSLELMLNAGNLVIVTDKRGEIIQYSASKAWLWENIENLKRLPVGAYMDKTCARAYPTSPKPTKW